VEICIVSGSLMVLLLSSVERKVTMQTTVAIEMFPEIVVGKIARGEGKIESACRLLLSLSSLCRIYVCFVQGVWTNVRQELALCKLRGDDEAHRSCLMLAKSTDDIPDLSMLQETWGTRSVRQPNTLTPRLRQTYLRLRLRAHTTKGVAWVLGEGQTSWPRLETLSESVVVSDEHAHPINLGVTSRRVVRRRTPQLKE
jgi:hypothetical protein